MTNWTLNDEMLREMRAEAGRYRMVAMAEARMIITLFLQSDLSLKRTDRTLKSVRAGAHVRAAASRVLAASISPKQRGNDFLMAHWFEQLVGQLIERERTLAEGGKVPR